MAVVIGVGNPFRRDDGFGVAVVVALRDRVPSSPGERPRLEVLDGEPASLVDAWTGAELAVLVDAGAPGAEPGRLHRVELPASTAGTATVLQARGSSWSSHAAGVDDAVALAAALGRLPRRLVLYSVEGADFGDGPGLSPAVAGAVAATAERIAAEVTAWLDPTSPLATTPPERPTR